ncbi:MAG: histidine phosphatase family protein [Planctomycetes bacterium]|nr:histidine phosphatase family protein [Planctomycetota bacterium]
MNDVIAPWYRRHLLLVIGLSLLSGFCLCWFGCKWKSKPTIVYVVRHAEKGLDPGNGDPALSAAGAARAVELARVLDRCDVQVAYATQFQRTQQTVAPTATLETLTPIVVQANDVAGLVASIRANDRGKIVLVAAHSNTAPEIVHELCGATVPAIDDETEFDNLYQVLLPRCGSPKLQHMKYGAPSP